jgi:hypothetical protein
MANNRFAYGVSHITGLLTITEDLYALPGGEVIPEPNSCV